MKRQMRGEMLAWSLERPTEAGTGLIYEYLRDVDGRMCGALPMLFPRQRDAKAACSTLTGERPVRVKVTVEVVR